MNWYLKKGDSSYGPVDLPSLQLWASEGRVAPEDALSEDQKKWIPASDLPELRMDWLLVLEDNSFYGPLHLLALRDLLRDETITLDTRIKHKSTGEMASVGEGLSVALMDECERLQMRADELALQLKTAELKLISQPVPAVAKPAAPEAAPQGKETEHEDSGGRFQNIREIQKWKKMYEDEHAQFLKREDDLNNNIRQLRQNELSVRGLLEQNEMKLKKLEKTQKMQQEAMEDKAGGLTGYVNTLMDSFAGLSQNYDNLMKQLADKGNELQSVIETRTLIEKDAGDRIRKMEEILRREQEEADRARRRLAEVEQSHLQLAQAFKELSDRFIRMRQPPTMSQQKESSPGGNPAPGSSGSGPKSRVKLTRS